MHLCDALYSKVIYLSVGPVYSYSRRITSISVDVSWSQLFTQVHRYYPIGQGYFNYSLVSHFHRLLYLAQVICSHLLYISVGSIILVTSVIFIGHVILSQGILLWIHIIYHRCYRLYHFMLVQ